MRVSFFLVVRRNNYAIIKFLKNNCFRHAWQISDNLLRRDEIWFAEKNSDGVSKLYSLADVQDEDGAKIRKDENYEKNYLNGKYRAIPILSRFDMFTETNSKNT